MSPALTIARFGARWYDLLTEASAATNAEQVGTLARLTAEAHETAAWRAFRGVHAAINGKPVSEPDLSRLVCSGCVTCRPETVAA